MELHICKEIVCFNGPGNLLVFNNGRIKPNNALSISSNELLE